MKPLYLRSVSVYKPVKSDSYLAALPAVQALTGNSLSFSSPVTIFVGENGTGKSTLLEAIAVASGFNPEGGTKNSCFSTHDSYSGLSRHLRLVRSSYPKDGFFLRAESFYNYNFASNIDDLDDGIDEEHKLIRFYGKVSLHEQSHGESFLALVQNRFSGNGLYLLDEPEAALSPARLLTLMAEIHALVKQNSQFIIATHSPILLAFPGALVCQFTDQGIEAVDYRKTDHYQLTRQFLECPERFLKHLFDDSST